MTTLFDNLILLNILQFISGPGTTCVFDLNFCPKRKYYIVGDIFLGKANTDLKKPHNYIDTALPTQILKSLPSSQPDKKELIEAINSLIDLNSPLTDDYFVLPKNIVMTNENKAFLFSQWLGLSVDKVDELIEASVQRMQFSYSLPVMPLPAPSDKTTNKI